MTDEPNPRLAALMRGRRKNMNAVDTLAAIDAADPLRKSVTEDEALRIARIYHADDRSQSGHMRVVLTEFLAARGAEVGKPAPGPDLAADLRALAERMDRLHDRGLALERTWLQQETEMGERMAALELRFDALEARLAWTPEKDALLRHLAILAALSADDQKIISRIERMTAAAFPPAPPEKPVWPEGCACLDHCGYANGDCSYPPCPHARVGGVP